MEQYRDSQYDDDLTVGADEYGDAFQTGDIDLFEFADDDASPISRLRQLILSIDWEITDEVLLQFNEELLDLKELWAADKVRMIYLQALEKISRYIYRDKSEAHPNAIKLLLSMYYNLEKIVLSEELTSDELTALLKSDVSKFEKLKKQISAKGASTAGQGREEVAPKETVQIAKDDAHALIDLKAIVLGIDWEITDKDLLDLRQEVTRLEEKFSDSRPKLVFLQGIGTLGTYIRKKKSNAHADAFTLLHSFYEGLEKIVTKPRSLAEEKAILYPEVEKFNVFKTVIAPTMATGMDNLDNNDGDYASGGDIAPAFADLEEDEVHGFREEEMAAAIGEEAPVDVDQHISSFFGEEEPALPAAASSPAAPGEEPNEAEALSDAFFDIGLESDEGVVEVDRETALRGVDVETEADDDSGEEALPEVAGEVAPALLDSREKSAFSEEVFAPPEERLSDELSGKLDAFFLDEEQTDDVIAEPAVEELPSVPPSVALQGVDVETEDDEEDEDLELDGEIAAIADFSEEDEQEVAPAFAQEEDEDAVAALFDDTFGMEEGDDGTEQPAVGEPEDLDFADDMVAADDLFEDLEDSLDESFDDVLTEPVDEAEIASAFAAMEEEVDEDEAVIEEMPAALDGIELAEDSGVDMLDEGDVGEQFDALFGGAEEGEADLEVDLEAGVAGDDAIEEVAAEIEEDDILSVISEEEAPTVLDAADEDVAAMEETLSDSIQEETAGAEVAAAAVLAGGAGAGVLLADGDAEDEVGSAVEDEYSAIFTVEEPEEVASVEHTGDDAVPFAGVEVEAVGSTILGALNECVEALGLELDDSVLQGLFAEVNRLRQSWVERPVEKSYLQLLSIVAQHIDRYRYEASAESHAILSELVEGLTQCLDEDGDVVRSQEQLLRDTFKVLEWQQDMLNRQAVERGGQLTFINPLRAEAVEDGTQGISLTDDDFTDAFADGLDSAVATGSDVNMDDIGRFVEEDEKLDFEEVLNQQLDGKRDIGDIAGGKVTEIVRREIESLRQALQQEITELRNAIKGDSK